MEQEKRGQWASNFGFLMAAVGSAVGLGNIWGFPYKMGASGGFAFLVIYLILVDEKLIEDAAEYICKVVNDIVLA